jgi:branched-chain amino acid aminotransferase
VLQLLRDAGTPVLETTLTRDDVLAADELFSTGNYGKVMPITQVEDRHLQVGHVYRKAREAYVEFARSEPV